MTPWIHDDGDGKRVLVSRTVWRTMTVLAVLLASAALVLSAVLAVRSASVDDQIHEGVIAGCERQNVVRLVAGSAITALIRVEIESLNAQIETSQSVRPSDLPGIPKARFHRLIQTQNQDRREGIFGLRSVHDRVNTSFEPVDCDAQYPAP